MTRQPSRMTRDEWEAAQSEDWHQVQLFAELAVLALHSPELGQVFHIPNGGLRHKKVAADLRALGVKDGMPDIAWLMPAGGFVGLLLELKVGNNAPTVSQRARLERHADWGHLAVVAYGWRAALAVVRWYLYADRTWRALEVDSWRRGPPISIGRLVRPWRRWEDLEWTA